MNITIDSNHSSTHVTTADTTSISYKQTPVSQKANDGGYTLDIADKVMDDKAYQGHGLTMNDIQEQVQYNNAQVQKDFMIVMSNCVSGEDLNKLAKEGFDPGSTDVETYVSILDKIKVTLAKAGVDIQGFTDNIDSETIEEITGSKLDANKLISLFKENDMPVTKENIEELSKAIVKGEGISELSDDAMKYMIMNQKEPTIENLYLAQYKSSNVLRQAKGYYSDRGYLAKKADDYSWDNLKKQMEHVIKQAGIDVNEQSISQAKWLVESGIELTEENMTLMSDLKKIEFPIDDDRLMELGICAIANGKNPSQANLINEKPIDKQATEIIEDIQSITDEAIHEVVNNGETINIKNLSNAQRLIDENKESVETQNNEENLKEIEARRQLEEIRLMMTQEAARRLIKSGLSIDTTDLTKLVEQLKQSEEIMKSTLYMGETTEENSSLDALYKDTLATTGALRTMPATVIGRIVHLSENEVLSLNRLHEEGLRLQKEYEKAEEKYETLMTAPRKDLGDKISKAFRNIDDILEDMNLETNDKNRRAVRILSYNTMELTKENIDAVKEADSLVSRVIERMTPRVTLDLIRQKKNPMEMSLEELDDYLSEQNKDPLDDTEKFSRYLQKLDKSGKITKEERQAYIGIYRMFRQIEKTDGAAIGSLIATNAEMSFKNVVSALKTAKKDIDYTIDEEFGFLERPEGNKEKEKYLARLSGEIKDDLAMKTTVEELQTIAGPKMERLPEMTIEGFYDEIKNNEAHSEEQIFTKERMGEIRKETLDAANIDDEIIQSLIDYEQPVSIDNIQAASMLIFDRGKLFKQVLKEEESKDTLLDKAKSLVDGLTDEKTAKASYQEMIKEAIDTVEKTSYKDNTKALDLKAVKSIYKGLSLVGNLSKEENYEIPVEIGGELTSVNLKIYHNSKKTGKVAVTMETQKLGKVACEMDVTKDRISGMVAFDDRRSQKDIEQLTNSLKEELKTTYKNEGIEKNIQLSLANAPNLKLNNFGQDRELFEENEKPSTKELYKTAKAFMTAIITMAA